EGRGRSHRRRGPRANPAGSAGSEAAAARASGDARRCGRRTDPQARGRRESARRHAEPAEGAALMAEIATVARPYAEATFKAALETNALGPVGEGLAFVAA